MRKHVTNQRAFELTGLSYSNKLSVPLFAQIVSAVFILKQINELKTNRLTVDLS